MEIRNYQPKDCVHIMKLFFDIVRAADAHQYPLAQLQQWASTGADPAEWATSLAQHHTVVAEENQKLVGFGAIAFNGYFNYLFVHPEYQRKGIATRMADTLENIAEEKAIGVVFIQLTNAVQTFFANRGYKVMKTNTVEQNGEQFHTFIMRKIIAD